MEPKPNQKREKLNATGLTKRLRSGVQINNVSLTIEPGEILGVLGPHGAGKNLLFQLLTGMIFPSRGQLVLGEFDLTRTSSKVRAIKYRVASMFPSSVPKKSQHSDTIGTQRIEDLEKCLETEPKFLVLDSLFSNCDPVSVQRIQTSVRFAAKQGVGVIFSDHAARDLFWLADRILLLEKGQVVCQGRQCEISSDETMSRLYTGAVERRK